MIHFLDFEASGLGPDSYPIQVGWCGVDGIGEEYFILPEAEWTSWDYNAEAVHGITQGDLAIKGRPAAEVARRLVEAVGNYEVYSDTPGFDRMWLDLLLEAGGVRTRVWLLDVREAYMLASNWLYDDLTDEGLDPETAYSDRAQKQRGIIAAARAEEDARSPRRHRALEDAQSLQRTWSSVRRRVAEAAAP